jgi:DNA-binding transcriptional regulator YbjK
VAVRPGPAGVPSRGAHGRAPQVWHDGVMTSEGAATPKGERRRQALAAAASELLDSGGFDAVRHRAVADRAGLPLASTTYYFGSLDELLVAAVEHGAAVELEAVRARIDDVTRRRRGADAAAELVLDLLVGQGEAEADREKLVARYERFVSSARRPAMGPLQRRLRVQLDELLHEVLARCGRTITERRLRQMVAVVDGAVVSALIEGRSDPRTVAREMLLEVLDDLAPPVGGAPGALLEVDAPGAGGGEH